MIRGATLLALILFMLNCLIMSLLGRENRPCNPNVNHIPIESTITISSPKHTKHLAEPNKTSLSNQADRLCATTGRFEITCDRSKMTRVVSQRSGSALTLRDKPRKLIYGMIFDCEEWMLEIKLNELGHAVDHFIIVEGLYTLQNRKRNQCLPALLESNERISKWIHKIVYIYDTEPIHNFQYWEAEVYYRDLIGLKGLSQIETAGDDLIIVTDVDEIPSVDFLWVLKQFDGFTTAIKIGLLWTYYNFKWVNDRPWSINAILSVHELGLVGNHTNRIRFDLAGKEGWSTGDTVVGWHCSWCMPTVRFLDKMSHFAHSELNQARFANVGWLNSMRMQGLWFPDAAPNGCIQAQLQLPFYVQANTHRFETLCSQDFVDNDTE